MELKKITLQKVIFEDVGGEKIPKTVSYEEETES